MAQVEQAPADLAVAAGVQTVTAAFPEVDILVNNLGIFEPKEFADISDADWLRFYETNVMSGIRLTRAYLPYMRAKKRRSHRIHVERIGLADSDGDDPLRSYENRPSLPCRAASRRHCGTRA